jgi:archaellum component FlaC
MANNSQNLKDTNDLLREQLELLRQVNELQQSSFDVSSAAVDSIKEALGINSRRSTFDSNTLKVNKAIAQSILDQKTGLRDLESIGKQISKNQDLINKAKIIEQGLNTRLAGQDLSKVKQFTELYQAQQDLVNELETSKNLSANQIQSLTRQISLNDTALDQLTQQLNTQKLQLAYTQINTKELEKQQELRENEGNIQKQLEKQLGLVGKIAKTLGHFRGIADDVNKALADTTAEMQRLATESGRIFTKWESFGMLVGKLGSNLMAHLSDPLTTITTMVKVFKMMVEAGFAADTQVTNLSKSLATSKDEADALRDRYVAIQNSGESIFETTKNLVGAQLQLADAFGTSRGFTEKQVRDQVKLTKQIGLEEEAAAGLQQLMLKNGQTADQATMSIVKQTASLSKQTGIQLNNKKILSDVAKVNGQLRLQYGNNTDQLAKAVIQSNKLGFSLEQSKKIAESLLNFESSIEAELSAELLTGRDLNLERARLLALNGKSVEAVKEMSAQIGSAADFTNMNVIQQEALAKAVGMSADELSNSLVFQENLNKLGGDARKQLEDKVNELKKAGQIDEANRLMAAAGDADLAKAALDRVDAQTQFNQGMERLQAIIGSMLEGPGQGFVNLLASAVSHAEALKNIFIGVVSLMAGMKAYKAVDSLMNAKIIRDESTILGLKVGQATASAIINPWAAIAGIVAAAAVGGIIYSSMKGDDVMSAGEGTGYGNRTLLMGKDAIQLNNQDTVIAGTNLFGGKQNQSTTVDNSSLIAEIRALRNEMNSRPVVVHSTVQLPNGEALARATNSENRKGHYGVQ